MLDLIGSLSPDDMRRLAHIANRYAWVNGWPAGDMLNEAFKRALRMDADSKKRRRCRKGANIFGFFASTMRSIANSEGNKGQNSEEHIPASSDNSEGTIDVQDDKPFQDEHLILRNLINDVIGLFEDDENAQLIIEGLGEGMRGKELKELTDLDETAYQSKRKLIDRRIKNAFPGGLKGILS